MSVQIIRALFCLAALFCVALAPVHGIAQTDSLPPMFIWMKPSFSPVQAFQQATAPHLVQSVTTAWKRG